MVAKLQGKADADRLLDRFPADLLASVIADGERCADWVGFFLHTLGIRGTPEKPLRLPLDFQLNLGAALQLWIWEQTGLDVHRGAGLPAAMTAIIEAMKPMLSSSCELPPDFHAQVFGLRINQFAWHGQRDLGADVVLGEMNDDAALDALAEHLWSARHAGS